jgi:hypothetical protein
LLHANLCTSAYRQERRVWPCLGTLSSLSLPVCDSPGRPSSSSSKAHHHGSLSRTSLVSLPPTTTGGHPHPALGSHPMSIAVSCRFMSPWPFLSQGRPFCCKPQSGLYAPLAAWLFLFLLPEALLPSPRTPKAPVCPASCNPYHSQLVMSALDAPHHPSHLKHALFSGPMLYFHLQPTDRSLVFYNCKLLPTPSLLLNEKR